MIEKYEQGKNQTQHDSQKEKARAIVQAVAKLRVYSSWQKVGLPAN